MFGFGKAKTHREIEPMELDALLKADAVLLVDVREPDEFAAGHIAGAVNMPLSTFSPLNVPDAQGRTVVLQCAGGKRSGMALEKCGQAQSTIDTHLAGGIAAWKSSGLPVVMD
ncbi:MULTISPECIES: rhodanese-like domain-containing protein [unclassified Sphingobium]|uniref:rhodanese-like domain-containing protein n=1 Tax=unclassified Sphingobium TaxID=2611147 RepID=UPI0022246327|nr:MULTISPECIES: rhodanese-like domain-containing protein [unclassified Sphingobium]MCW2412602.1 rhodanese-related sulfurtransferase [Sphingobium sp. B8D3D]MCW2415101.1 rhodanese-related sulfurtransferase [Sphingobium sp. B8D3A]